MTPSLHSEGHSEGHSAAHGPAHAQSAFPAFLLCLLLAVATSLFGCADRQEGATGNPTADAGASTSTQPAIPSIEPQELAQRLAAGSTAPLVLDVRTQAEFDAGHIPGALHIPHDELAGRLNEVDSSNGIAVHCMVGPRARKAEATLASAGVPNIMHLEGGYRAWAKAGLQTEN
ncbi:MAG: rhodanese-like domain-containing protein [Myxococcota bacterium]